MSYSFPVLTNQEILLCLSELEIPATELDLQKPTFETAKQIYYSLVQLLVGVTREELQQPVFEAVDALEFPALHEESIGTLAFNRALTDLVLSAGIHDFALKDLYKPESGRTRRILSAVINFAKFREEKVQAYEELRENSDATQERYAQLQEANLTLNNQLRNIMSERDAQQPEVDQLERETAELAAKIAALNKEHTGLTTELESLKATDNELSDKVAKEKSHVDSAHQEAQRLRGQIVQSPDRLQRALTDLSNTVEKDKSAVGDAEKKSRELQTRLDTLSKVERDVQKCVNMMMEADVEMAKHKEISRSIKSAKSKIQANGEEIWRLDTEKQHLKRQEQITLDRMQRLAQQGGLKQEAAVAAVAAAREEKCAVESHNAATQARLAELEHQIRAVEQHVKDGRSQHRREMKTVSVKYGMLETKVKEYQQQLLSALPPSPQLGN
ncbi:hypothetical protein CYMTET_50565 [Cymbomonas tetramitiformis]|uniref:Kinetochore protein NUF2 n=1 Tax=Cymbomonas tetramitiformis TaxID=36881 RepID=A0AAE0ETK9_9CHLO|nr:hypothetical protein CYMTET_50565 [Cymbomonas tetramitiformis]